MKHNFPFKLIGTLDKDTLDKFKVFVLNREYQIEPGFSKDIIQVSTSFNYIEPVFRQLFDLHLAKYFKLSGHIGSNIARMSPNSYYSEHSDYTGAKLGHMQDSIIKFQIPIITNQGAGLMWRHDQENHSACVSLIEGGIYIFDNCRHHSSVNFSNDNRYWLTTRWHIDSLLDKSLLD
jgi:hypothetical protein